MSACSASPLVAVNVHRDHQKTITLSVWSIAAIQFIECGEIVQFLRENGTATAFLIALTASARSQVDDAIRRLRRARRDTPIIAYADRVDDWASRAVRAIRCGADHIALHGFDDLRSVVLRVLHDITLAPACGATLRLVLPYVPARAHPIVEYCTLHAPKTIAVSDVADQFARSPRSVNRQLHAVGLPSIAATISWCRLFVAAYLMSHEHHRVDRVALELSYGSGSALRNMLRRYTSLTAADVRYPDAVMRLAQLYSSAPREIEGGA